MAVNNYLLKSAQRKDCLLALLPCQGGTVANLLDPAKQVYPDFNCNPSGTSWAERNGLIKLTNINLQNNVFTAADPTNLAGISTQINLQSNNTSKTFIARTMFHKISDGKLHISPIFNQGMYAYSEAFFTFGITFRENAAGELFFHITYSFPDQPRELFTHIVKESFLECWHTIAVVYNCDDPANSITQLFIDGQHIFDRTFSHTVWHTPSPPYDTMTLGIREDIELAYLADNQLAWAIIFDTALSAEEIVLFK